MNILLAICLAICLSGAEAGSLLSPINIVSRDMKCCEGRFILSCQLMKLNSSALGDQDLDFAALDLTLQFNGMVGDSSTSYHYVSKEAEAVLTYSSVLDDVYGHIGLFNGKSFVIEYCGDSVHALKEVDVAAMQKTYSKPQRTDYSGQEKKNVSLVPRVEDTTTIVTYSVKIYYTPTVNNKTADIDTFIDQIIAETNQGYINSNVPLRVTLLCSEMAPDSLERDWAKILDAFEEYKGSAENLRGTADTAMLLVTSMFQCGLGLFDTTSSGRTISAVNLACAIGDYTPAHELGHNIGLDHNKKVNDNPNYPHGHGNLIANPNGGEGFATIMAYATIGQYQKINYYSSPDVVFPTTNTPTGETGVTNNRRILIENRFALAAIGDESDACSVTPVITTTMKVEIPNPSYCTRTWYFPRFKNIRLTKKMKRGQCIKACRNDIQCIAWTHRGRKCFHDRIEEVRETGSYHGPSNFKRECTNIRYNCQYKNRKTKVQFTANFDSPYVQDCEARCKADAKCSWWYYWEGKCSFEEMVFYRKKGFRSGPKYC